MTDQALQALIEDIKKFCVEHYEDGFDGCVECWGTEDYAKWIKDFPEVVDVKTFAKSYGFVIDHRRDIEGTAF